MTLDDYRNWFRGYIDAVSMIYADDEKFNADVLEEAYNQLKEVVIPPNQHDFASQE